MTMPTLMTKIQAKQLEAQFKRADSIILQALTKAAFDYADFTLDDLYVEGAAGGKNEDQYSSFVSMVNELNEYWLQQFTSLTKIKHVDKMCYDPFGEKFSTSYWCYDNTYILQDGMLVSSLIAGNRGVNHPKCVEIMFDTNGPYKGPNRRGHDVFIYNTCYAKSYYQNIGCSAKEDSTHRFDHCYNYAHRNQNPVKSGRGYWEILFKPKSYWNSAG